MASAVRAGHGHTYRQPSLAVRTPDCKAKKQATGIHYKHAAPASGSFSVLACQSALPSTGSIVLTERVEHLMQAAAAAGKHWYQGLAQSRAVFG